MRLDPIEFEIFKNLFVSIAEEMGVTLCRTGFSPNIKERLDYSCAIYDASGQTIAQGDHMPVHLGAMPLSVRAAIDHVAMEPGDTVILNDPFRGGTHLPDITLVSPVFLKKTGPPAFFVANRAHHSDVGGMSPGSMPLAREIFQEGLIIPPIKLIRRGVIDNELMSFILANVRTPDEREGDLTAQIASNRVGESRLREIAAKYAYKRVAHYAAATQDYTERVLRRTIADIPDGAYSFEDFLDDDGFSSDPIFIRVAIRIAGDSAEVDFTGSDLQTGGGVNANLAITLSASLYAFRCLVTEDVLYNAGIARPIHVIAPPGTVVNALHPSAVAGGNVETSQRITDVVLGALSKALPQVIPAASQGTMNNVTLGGTFPAAENDPRAGTPFAYYETTGGGMGGRNGLAGLSGVHTHMSNTRNTPVEAIEHYLPVRIRTYSLRQGSGGAGQYPGGEGIVREYEVLTDTSVTVLSERRVGRPYGAQGGEPGASGRNSLLRATAASSPSPAKSESSSTPATACASKPPAAADTAHPVRPRRNEQHTNCPDRRPNANCARPRLRMVEGSSAFGEEGAHRSFLRVDARLLRRHALLAGARLADGRPAPQQGRRRNPRLHHAARRSRRRPRLRRHRRPLRPHSRAHGERAHLRRLHRRLRPLAKLRSTRRLPHPPRPRHGRRVGQRRIARLGDLAGRASRQSPRLHAELLGDRLRARRSRRSRRHAHRRLARRLLRRRPPGLLRSLDPAQRRRARSLEELPQHRRDNLRRARRDLSRQAPAA